MRLITASYAVPEGTDRRQLNQFRKELRDQVVPPFEKSFSDCRANVAVFLKTEGLDTDVIHYYGLTGSAKEGTVAAHVILTRGNRILVDACGTGVPQPNFDFYRFLRGGRIQQYTKVYEETLSHLKHHQTV